MRDFEAGVLIGNVVVYPNNFRKFLKKSHYFGSYDPEKEILTLTANHGNGGENLFEFRNISYESAKKLMEGLGLDKDNHSSVSWEKWNPVFRLGNDGSEDAARIRREMLELGLPFTEHKCEPGNWTWFSHPYCYGPSTWTVGEVLKMIRKQAKCYEKQLTTTP